MNEIFRNRNFRKLFLSNLFSGFGQGMTMIGISWYLVESTGRASLLGTTMLLSSIMTLLIGPYSGTLIDRYSRKAILQLEQLGGFTVLALVAAWGFWGNYQEWMMVLVFLASMFMFQVHEPTQSAFIQETFEQKHYNMINSTLEIQNQTALVLAGAFAGMLLGKYGLHIVLILNTLTYLIAFLSLTGIDYVFTQEKQTEKSPRTSWVAQFQQSWVYIKEKRGFILFGIAALIPFLAVMLTNLLNPIFVSQVLEEDVAIYSMGEVTYSIGAVLAGFLLTWFRGKIGAFPYMVANYILMAIALVVTVVIPIGSVFVLLSAFMGWCNVSTRLIRQSIYMELLPNRFMGRVLSFFRSIGTCMRLLLLALFTIMLDSTGAAVGYLVLAGLLVMATLGIVFSMRMLMQQVDTPDAVADQGTLKQ
ncbi:MFS transporter [Brevibacillus sp. 179-C9.3 HS]|uniref:MFS transporter n=1 Tax=unclassified Brevibacillus TaxID=2684853 RepID=UPI0039A0D827